MDSPGGGRCGAAVEERRGLHDAVLLEEDAVFHDEAHVAQGVDILQRVAFHRDQVSGQAGFDGAALLIKVADFVAVDGHDFENFGGRYLGGLPALQKVDDHLAAIHAGDVVIGVGGEGHLDVVRVGILHAFHLLVEAGFGIGRFGVVIGVGRFGADAPDSFFGHEFVGFVVERDGMLDGPDAGFDGAQGTGMRLDVTGDFHSGLGGFGDEELHLVDGVAVGFAIDADLDDLGAIQDVAADGFDDFVVGVGVQVFGFDEGFALGHRGELAAESADDDAGVDDGGSGNPALFDGDAEGAVGVVAVIAEVAFHGEAGVEHSDAVGDGLDGADGGGVEDAGEVVVVVFGFLFVGEGEVIVSVDEAGGDVVVGEVDGGGAGGDGDVGADGGEFAVVDEDDLVGGGGSGFGVDKMADFESGYLGEETGGGQEEGGESAERLHWVTVALCWLAGGLPTRPTRAMLLRMRMAALLGVVAATLMASEAYPPARFTDPERVSKLESAMPAVDEIFRRYASEHRIPGMVWGVVIDDRLAHVSTFGAGITEGTVFRIASMTKSFTALAVLKLRDEGKLSLDDTVAKWIPEFAQMPLPTRDTPPLKLRQIISHSAGFPEDNPWGDQQLSATDEDMTGWLRRGIPFSTPPATRYEYSNFAFGLLGRVVTKASGMPYEQYVREEILKPLHMTSTTYEFTEVPAQNRAMGYRLLPNGSYAEEPSLPHGVFGSTGGLLTDAADMGRYLAFQLSAWPPRDDADPGPVRRASVREMSHMWTPSNLTVTNAGGVVKATESGYGFGLRVSTDCRFEHIVGHGGGLPGFGSYMMWLPDYGVAMFAMANLTYAGPAEPISQAWDVLLKTGGLQKRELPPSPVLTQTRGHLVNLWKHWDEAEAKEIASMNFFLDVPAAQRMAEMDRLKAEVGSCSAFGPVRAENWMRGQFNMTCEKAMVGVFFTMAPTMPPKMQHLEFRKIAGDGVRMGAPTGPPAGVSCPQ